jgi:threonine/homoserine/homoserine lactone efflux protein
VDALLLDFWVLPQGIIIGFSIAAPVGPIGILCIQRTLTKGRAHGLISGLGAASADAIYGSIAGFGLTLVSEVLIAQQSWLQLIGGAFLCYLGLRTLLSKPGGETKRFLGGSLFGNYASTFLLTIINPMTIISFAAVFIGLGIGNSAGNFGYAGLFVAGIFAGSTFWWVLLTSIVEFFRTKFDTRMLKAVNLVSGFIILGFGLYFLLTFLKIF